METFKHALVAREFARGAITSKGPVPAEDWNLPLLQIEAPPTPWTRAPRLPIDRRPQEYLAGKAPTIAGVLHLRDALPGRPDDWSAFTSCGRNAPTDEDALDSMAHIPARPSRNHWVTRYSVGHSRGIARILRA